VSVRNAAGGTKVSLGRSSQVDSTSCCREEEEDPKGGARSHAPCASTTRTSGPTSTRPTLKESQAHKRTNPPSRNGRRGPVLLEKPSRSARNGEASMGAA